MKRQIVGSANGDYHSLILLENGRVYGWGNNNYGQLGNDTNKNTPSPNLIETIPGKVVSIATGGVISLALLETGEVYGWGLNGNGRWQDTASEDSTHPLLIMGIPGKVITIAAGNFHSLALLDSGEVYGWGWNRFGQLGDKTPRYSYHPRLIKALPGKVVGLAAGANSSLALLDSGDVYSWGSNEYSQLRVETTKNLYHPQLIKNIPGRVVAICSGYTHSMALLDTGEVYGWGRNEFYQLGNGTTKNNLLPQLILAVNPVKVVSIAAGNFHSLALLKNGDVYGWGQNDVGQLGNSKSKYEIYPHIISKINKNILLSPFGRGGRVVGYTELEKKFRELLAQAFRL